MRKTKKPGTKGSKHHGNVSYRKPGKPMDPADHVANKMKAPEGGLMQGNQLGMDPAMAPMPQTMQNPGGYPGEDSGAQ